MKDFLKRNIFVLLAAIILVTTVVFVFVFGRGGELWVLGYKPSIVATGSMEPAMKTNAFTIVQKGDAADAKVDDIIVFRFSEDGSLASHRVIAIAEEGIVTKGDANAGKDFGFVTSDNYVGKVIFYTNTFVDYVAALRKPFGVVFFLILPLVATALVVFGIKILINSRRRPNGDDAPEQIKKTKK